MPSFRSIAVLGCMILAAFAAGGLHAADPSLGVLAYPAGPEKLETTEIGATPGAVKSPFAGKPQTTWILKPGEASAADVAPPERKIELYRMTDAKSLQLLCTIAVKFFQNDAGWQPAYRIEPRFTLVKQGDDWIPVPRHTGDVNVIQLSAPVAANAEGYFPALIFGLPGAALAIDAWKVN